MSAELRVRDAVRGDVSVIVDIGRRGMSAQYVGLVDPTAVQAAIEQSYALAAVEACVEPKREAPVSGPL